MEFDLENPLPPSNEKYPSLFQIESDHMPSNTYLQNLNSEGSNLSVRRGIVSSIFNFSPDFDPFLSYLAINYMDRFLSIHPMPDGKPWIFKLVAISCISLALKMRKTEYSVSDLMQDGGFMFDSATIGRMEMLILGALKWRMRSTNPFCFVDYFIQFLKLKKKSLIQALKNRANEIILKAQHDINLLLFKPSIIAASALLYATNDLFHIQFASFRNAVCSCSYVDKEEFSQCYDMMQDVAMEGYDPVWFMASSSCTPANVLDLNYLSSSVSGSGSQRVADSEKNAGEN
ncbi:hypothetical protein CASFOL_010596 [Castilleja foliolosa]|uniref:Uncharacterized protein n=1 Tax=Castilleja foliolosa TaxID=1961234 RepID=A0ABD3DX91_9LAMI